MSPWLVPAIVASMMSAIVLTVVYFYLYLMEKRDYLAIWSLAWLTAFMRYFFHLIAEINQPTTAINLIRYILILLSSIFLLWGILSMTSRQLPRWLRISIGVSMIWIIATSLFDISYQISVTPVYLFLAFVHMWSGIIIIKMPETQKISKLVTGCAFFLLGINIGLYPFTYKVIWYMPWGFSLSSFFGLIIAISIVMIYFEINRHQLESTEKKVQLLAANIQDVIFSIETFPKLKITYLSPAFEKMCGYSVSEVISNPELLRTIIHPDDRDTFIDKLTNLTPQPSLHTLRLKNIDAGTFWVEISITPVFSDDIQINAVEGTIRDVTSRYQTEKALQREKKFTERIMETNPIGITILNRQGQITYANKVAEMILGIDRDTITSRNFNNIEWKITDFDGISLSSSELPFEKVIRSHETVHQFRHAIEKPGGERVYLSINASPMLDENGEIENVITTIEDITAQYKTERALQESEQRYRTLFEKMLNGFALHEIILDEHGNAHDYRFIDANPAFGIVTGIPPEDLIGKTILEVMPKTEKYWIDTYTEVALTGEPRHFQNYSTELNRYYEVVSYSPAYGQFATIILDITETKQAEQELKIALKDLRQRSAETTALLEATRTVLTNNRFLPAADFIFESLRQAIGAQSGFITLISADGNLKGIYQPGKDINIQTSEDLPFFLTTFHSQTCRDGKVIIDNQFKPNIQQYNQTQTSIDIENIMFAPMMVNNQALGVLILQNKDGGFTANDAKLAAGFSEIAAIALLNSQNLESLEESEERFRAVADSASDAIISFDHQGIIIQWNSAADIMTGYRNDEAKGQNLRLILPDLSQIIETYNKNGDLSAYTLESTAIKKSGEEFPVEVSLSQWMTKAGAFYTTIMRDISNRKKAEEDLRESESLYRTLFENAPIGIGLSTIDGKLVEANNSLLQMFGYSIEEMKSIPLETLYLNQNERNNILQSMGTNQSIINQDVRYFNKNKELFDTNITTTYINLQNQKLLLLMILDISSRKKAEEALYHSEERYRTLVENVNEVIFTSTEAGIIHFISPRIQQIFGYSFEELLGKNIIDIIFPEDRRLFQSFYHQSLYFDIPIKEFRMLAADQSVRNILVSIRPQQKENGHLEAVGILADITERVQMEKALATSQKLASIGTLTAAVSHEIKSPLQVIVGTSESIIRRIDRHEIDIDRIKQQMETINRNGWRISAITGSLLNYARSSDGDIEEDDINDIVNDTLLLIEHQLANWSRINVMTELAPNPPNLLCNRNKITQILINLLMNARDAMPDGGDITIKTNYYSDTHEVLLMVEDTGTGIPDEIKKKIFEPFFTTKPKGEGSGLGLSIIQDIVKEHRGSISIDSVTGKGTTISISFPAIE